MMISIRINGMACEAKPDELLIDVIRRANIELPAVCYHEQLGGLETCDTCVVGIDGKLLRACGTNVAEGMRVSTTAASVQAAQREAFDRILSNHMLYCTVCDNNNGNCTIHNTTKMLKVEHQKIPYKPKPYEVDESGPFYRYDPNQCVLCARCVEACQNVEVNETLSINWDDPNPRVLWDGGATIGDSSCVSCGHCVTVCPCNALMEKSMIGHAGFLSGISKEPLDGMIDIVKGVEPEAGYGLILQVSEAESKMRESRVRRTKTVCTYCGVGCSFDVWTKDRHILKVAPEHGPTNGISTCIKGKFGWDFVNSKDRLTTPLIRDEDQFREASWDEALSTIANKFTAIKQQHGAHALAFISSSKCTNEENYLMQKLARAVIGTNNIDNCSRYCQAPATVGLFRTVGYGGDAGSIHDIANAGLVLIVGSNTAESHPVIATRVKSSHKLRGQKLIVADIRKHEMAERADIFFRPRPGSDLVWLSAVTRYIIDNNLHKKDFIDKWVNDFDKFRDSLEKFTMERAANDCDLSIDILTQVAKDIATADGVCVLWAMGVTQHSMGSDTSTAISNLLLTTGNYMRPGAGAYPLRGHNNVQGAGDMGAAPDKLPGYQSVDDPEVCARFEAVWNAKLPVQRGLDNHEMVEAIHAGNLKSLYLFGEEMSLVDSNANVVEDAFKKLDFFVVQDVFFSHTAQFADVVLPASPSLEKEGTFSNTERRIQRLYQVFEPLGESRPDWLILTDLAKRLGADWGYSHPSEIMHEIAQLSPIHAGVTYDRLEGYNTLQWPVAADGSDQSLLYRDGFPFPDGKARFYPVDFTSPVDQPDNEFDLHLNNGNLLEHFHAGNMTYRVPGIREKVPEVFVEVSSELAKSRQLESGSLVELTSRYGRIEVKVLVTDRVTGNQIFMTMNSSESPVNRLIGSHTDTATHTPAYKEASVRMRVLSKEGTSPMPRSNPRFGHRTPMPGVEVQKKWANHNYTPPEGLASE